MIIAHTCDSCHHPDYWGGIQRHHMRYDAAGTIRQWPNRTCGQGCHRGKDCDWREPTIRPTYAPDTTVQTGITPPGEPWSNTGLHACGCSQCLALYERVPA